MRIGPLDLGHHTIQRHDLRGIELRRERMVSTERRLRGKQDAAAACDDDGAGVVKHRSPVARSIAMPSKTCQVALDARRAVGLPGTEAAMLIHVQEIPLTMRFPLGASVPRCV